MKVKTNMSGKFKIVLAHLYASCFTEQTSLFRSFHRASDFYTKADNTKRAIRQIENNIYTMFENHIISVSYL